MINHEMSGYCYLKQNYKFPGKIFDLITETRDEEQSRYDVIWYLYQASLKRNYYNAIVSKNIFR